MPVKSTLSILLSLLLLWGAACGPSPAPAPAEPAPPPPPNPAPETASPPESPSPAPITITPPPIVITITPPAGRPAKPEEPPLPRQEERKEITFIKMVSSEPGDYTFTEEEVSRLKRLNINSIRICPLYSMGPDGEPALLRPKQYYINMIRKAKYEGLAVLLEPNMFVGGALTRLESSEYLDKLFAVCSEWAKIAEEEKVELYSPLNEPDVLFGGDQKLIAGWIERSRDLRPLFSGYLVLKFADLGPAEIEGIDHYDYIAFDIIWGDDRLDELKQHLKRAMAKGNELKEAYSLRGFFFGELGAEKARVDEHTQAEIFRTILEETWGKVDGYDFLGWSELEFGFKGREGEEVIREWFSR